MPIEYLPRLADSLLAELLRDHPALLVTGPRATGKTTTVARHARTVVRLDEEQTGFAFRADPDAALRDLAEPVLLDEWQAVPAVLGAVKRAVDTDPRRGRFIVTGSVRGRIDQPTWPGTGRLIRVGMSGFTARELVGADLNKAAFVDRIADAGIGSLTVPADPPDLRDYLELAVLGGFPEPVLRLQGQARKRWWQSYLDELLTRDAENVDGGRDPERLRRYFEAYALNSAGVVPDKTLYDAARLNRKTADAYDQMLRNLLVVYTIPSWSTNRLKRLVQTPKRHLVDAGLMCAVLEVGVAGLLRDGHLLGRVLETFVVAQLHAERELGLSSARLYHLRQEGGAHEVDLLAEFPMNRVVAIEVKAESGVDHRSAKHLRWLRDELGDRFIAGVVLYTGRFTYALDDRIIAAPICTIWG